MAKICHGEEAVGSIANIPANLIVAIMLGITQFFSMMSYISITAISREGENAVFMKYIPISLHQQFIYKAIPNVIMNTIMNMVIFIIAEILLPIPILYLVVVLILSTLLSIIQSFLNIMRDLRKPKLRWDTEYAVVKQNMNLIWPMVWEMLSIGAIVGLTMLFFVVDLNAFLAFAIVVILLVGIIYLLNRYIKKHQKELFEKIY